MDFGGWAIEITRGFEVAHAEHAVFDGPYPIDAPLIVGDRLGELALDRRLCVEAVHDFFGELSVSVHVFRREHDNARGEAVAEGVHAGAGLTLRGSARAAAGSLCFGILGTGPSVRRSGMPVRFAV